MTGDIFAAAAAEEEAAAGASDPSGSDGDSDDDFDSGSDSEDEEPVGEATPDEEEPAPMDAPDWVNDELERQLAAEVGASLAADDTVSAAVKEAAALAGTDAEMVWPSISVLPSLFFFSLAGCSSGGGRRASWKG